MSKTTCSRGGGDASTDGDASTGDGDGSALLSRTGSPPTVPSSYRAGSRSFLKYLLLTSNCLKSSTMTHGSAPASVTRSTVTSISHPSLGELKLWNRWRVTGLARGGGGGGGESRDPPRVFL